MIAKSPEMNNKAFRQDILIDMSNMVNVDHPNIVKIRDIYEDTTNIYIVTDFIVEGNLYNFLIQKRQIAETQLAQIVNQILLPLVFCHRHNLTLKNLKPTNILFDAGLLDQDKIVLYLSDVGISNITRSGSPVQADCILFMAPEIVQNQPITPTADIWSLGAILYFIITHNLIKLYDSRMDKAQFYN